MIIAVFVDDMISMTETTKDMATTKKILASQFKMKDMGELHFCLGIGVEQDAENGTLKLNQEQYILKMLEKFGLSEAKTVSTPADPNVKLQKEDGVSKIVNPTLY